VPVVDKVGVTRKGYLDLNMRGWERSRNSGVDMRKLALSKEKD
jgi:hypothetical protein